MSDAHESVSVTLLRGSIMAERLLAGICQELTEIWKVGNVLQFDTFGLNITDTTEIMKTMKPLLKNDCIIVDSSNVDRPF